MGNLGEEVEEEEQNDALAALAAVSGSDDDPRAALSAAADAIAAGPSAVENAWICGKCGHKFPEEEAERVPNRASMVIHLALGIPMQLAGITAMFWYFYTKDYKLLIQIGPLVFLAGSGLVSHGLRCRKGFRAKCTSCYEPVSVPLESKDGKYFLKKFKKKQS